MVGRMLKAKQDHLLTMLPYLSQHTADRIGGTARRHMREWLTRQMYYPQCVVCGNSPTHMGRLISGRYLKDRGFNPRGGYVWGNLALMCGVHRERIITPDLIHYQHLVPLTGPTFTKSGIVYL